MFGDQVATKILPTVGTWSDSKGVLAVDAIGSVAIAQVEAQESLVEYVVSMGLEAIDEVEQVGLIFHSNAMLDRGVGVFYYPHSKTVRAMDMIAPRGDREGEYGTVKGQYSPVAEINLEEPLMGSIEFTVVVRGDLVFCAVNSLEKC